MFDSLLTTLPTTLGYRPRKDRCTTVTTHVPVGSVIPDVLLAHSRAEPIPALKNLTFLDAAVLSCIQHYGKASLADTHRLLHVTPAATQRVFSELTRAKLLSKSDDGTYVLNGALDSGACEILGIEVKLSRWREALAQAFSYLRFATAAYVVLDGLGFNPRPSVRNYFRDSGIGLVLQFGTRTELVIKAERHNPCTPDRFIALRQIARARRRPKYSLQATLHKR